MSRKSIILAVVLTILLFILCYVGDLLTRGISFGFNEDTSVSTYAFCAIATLLGIAASVLVNALKQAPATSRVSFAFCVDALSRPGSAIAFLVSPITFYGVLAAVGGLQIGLAMYLVAFQNGFFWQQILKDKET